MGVIVKQITPNQYDLLYTYPMPEWTRSRPSQLYVEVGQNISRFRKELAISQADLSSKLNVAQQHVAAIEVGKRRISLEDLFTVAQILKVSVTALLPIEEDPKKPGPRPKLAVAYEKLLQLPEKEQGIIMGMIDSLTSALQKE